jgi:hypothetical protein
MEDIRGSTKSAMAGESDQDPPRTRHRTEKVGWGVDDSKRVGWPGGLAKLSGRWSSGGDVARDMGDD